MKRILLLLTFHISLPAFAGITVLLSQPDTRIVRVENGLIPAVLIREIPPEGQSPSEARVRTWSIDERMKYHNVPGVSIALFHDWKLQWAKGYGVMDADTKEPVTEKTLFVAGSISKPVAVAGALRMVQEGKLLLDENINKFLKTWKLPENELTAKQPVTLRLLMSHSAGVTVHGFPGYAAGEAVPTIVQILDGVPPSNTGPIRVDIEPGARWRYAGGGTTIMQLAMCDIEGKEFPRLMEEKVLSPAGMSSSSYEQRFDKLPPERFRLLASGHKESGKVIPGKRHVYPEMAAAGMWTTPTDLCRFAIEIGLAAKGKSDKVLSREMASLMLKPQKTIQVGQDMALGFFLEYHDNFVYYGHGGGDEGFICGLLASRDGGYGVAVMTNTDGPGARIISEIMRSVAREYGWEGYLPEPVDEFPISADLLAMYAGRYKVNSDLAVTVRVAGRRLECTESDGGKYTLFPLSEKEFTRQDADMKFQMVVSGGAVSHVQVWGSGRPVTSVPRVADDARVPMELLREGKINEAIDAYRAIAKTQPKDPAVNENRLNNMGYTFLREKKNAEAIALFALNVELYPGSANTYDSLGEAYMDDGQKDLAIKNYTRSLELDPKNTNAVTRLKKLRAL